MPNKQANGVKSIPLGRKGSRSLQSLKHADFERVYEAGQRHYSRLMTVFFLPRKSGGPRFGFTVGKAFGGAVVRNRLKRRMREAVRGECQRFHSAVDVVFNPKKLAVQAEFAALAQEVGRALQLIAAKTAAVANQI